MADPAPVAIQFDELRLTGRFIRPVSGGAAIWDRLRGKALLDSAALISEKYIELSWPSVLALVREFGNRAQQEQLNFRFRPEGQASTLLRQFAAELKATRAARTSAEPSIPE